jgi:hypothetical protein
VLLIRCSGFGKTPLIYAIEYRTYLFETSSIEIEVDLLRLLINHGANVNQTDVSGLTPLFYAIYRGVPSIVQLLLQHHADHRFENTLGYSPLRYALGCLAYGDSNEITIYQRRLDIVAILLEQYQMNDVELKQAILGCSPTMSSLFPLFDFIFYARTKAQSNFVHYAWHLLDETYWPCSLTYGNVLLAQNLLVFHSNIEHIVYFLQRMYIDNYQQLFIFYLQHVYKDNECFNRFLLLLYCAFIDMNGNQ